MSEVVVVTKRVTATGTLAQPNEEAAGAVGCLMVRVNEAMITAEDGLVSVEQKSDAGALTVVITLMADRYSVVSHLEQM